MCKISNEEYGVLTKIRTIDGLIESTFVNHGPNTCMV